MVIKLVRVIATSVTALILLLIVNVIYLFNKFKSYISDIASKSFLEILQSIYNIIPSKDKIGVLVQMLILFGTSAGFIVHSLKKSRKSKIPKLPFKVLKKSKTRTDLDNLYKILQDRKEVSVGDIERTFEISNDIAMDWCKILENAELAMIDYPTFKKPILRIPEVENDNKNDDKKKEASEKDEKFLVKDEGINKNEEFKENIILPNINLENEKMKKHVVKKNVKKKDKTKAKNNISKEKKSTKKKVLGPKKK